MAGEAIWYLVGGAFLGAAVLFTYHYRIAGDIPASGHVFEAICDGAAAAGALHLILCSLVWLHKLVHLVDAKGAHVQPTQGHSIEMGEIHRGEICVAGIALFILSVHRVARLCSHAKLPKNNHSV